MSNVFESLYFFAVLALNGFLVKFLNIFVISFLKSVEFLSTHILFLLCNWEFKVTVYFISPSYYTVLES